jgi:chemotaxis protein histidine kinase CheA
MSDSGLPQIDPAMLELFQAEMETHVPVLNEGLLALEKGQIGASQIEAMMRAAHSIKGAARIVGIAAAVRLAHVMEDCFTAAKDGQITLTSDAVDVLLQGVDALQRVCSANADSTTVEAGLDDLLAQLSLLKTGTSRPTSSKPMPEPRPESAGVVSAEVQPQLQSVTLPAILDSASCETVRQELMHRLAHDPATIELNFAQLRELSAAGLALLVSFVREVESRHPPLVLESNRVGPEIQTVMRVAGLSSSFGIAE